ncbi:hypothetical protein [Fervidobacterium islandicum]|uniref:hypothetical protein n=1 Tax=Fervidobacterium islandicum TaxID=2423 RepID=UPI003A7223DA
MEYVFKPFRKELDWFSYMLISAVFPDRTTVLNHSSKFLVLKRFEFLDNLEYSYEELKEFETELKPQLHTFYMSDKERTTFVTVPKTEYNVLIPRALELYGIAADVPTTWQQGLKLLLDKELTIVPEWVEIQYNGADIEDVLGVIYWAPASIVYFPNKSLTVYADAFETRFYTMMFELFNRIGVEAPDYFGFRGMLFEKLTKLIPKSRNVKLLDHVKLFYSEYELNRFIVCVLKYLSIGGEKFTLMISLRTHDVDELKNYGIGVVNKTKVTRSDIREMMRDLIIDIMVVSQDPEYDHNVPYNGLYAAYTYGGEIHSMFEKIVFDMFV